MTRRSDAAHKPPDAPTKVSIDTPPLTVTIEAHAPLEVVARRALALYREVWRPDMARPGSGVGFATERSEGS